MYTAAPLFAYPAREYVRLLYIRNMCCGRGWDRGTRDTKKIL